MPQKQEGEVVSTLGTYDQLLSHLLHVGETLLGQTQGVFGRLSREIALVTHEQVHLVPYYQPPSPPPRFRVFVQFKNRFYGMLITEPDAANPVSSVIPSETATMLAQACGWLFYTIEVTALQPELGEPYTQAHRARTSLKERPAAVLALMCQGYDHKEIAKRLNITPATVRKYREQIYAQFDTHTVRETIFAAFSAGLFYPIDDLHPHIMSSEE